MEICYEITRGDFLAFQKYAYKHARDKKMRLFMYVFFAALAAYFSLFNFDVPLVVRAVWFLLNLGTLLLISAFQGAVINAYVFRKAIPKGENNGVLGHHKIVLNDKGLIETMSVNETFHSWKSVERIEQSDEYIFIYIGPSMAHFIPKRFFADRGDAERFFAVAQSYKKAADKGFPQLPRTEQGEDEFSPVERMIRA